MRIQLVSDGSEYMGTPVQIVSAMQHGRFNMHPHNNLREYIDSACGTLRDWFGISLPVAGDTDEVRAASFVDLMLANNLARPLPMPAQLS